MVQLAQQDSGSAAEVEEQLRRELAASDQALANTRPILRHLLRSDDHSIFSDEIMARVRGMLRDVARQLIVALGEASGQPEPQAWAGEACEELADAFADNAALVGHAHALAVEWQLCERLQTRLGLDPVLPPLVQGLIASTDGPTAEMAMALLAAQARFGQQQRRMELPLTELPGDLFHAALRTLRAHVADHPESEAASALAEAALRERYEERRSRIAMSERLITALRGDAVKALSLEQAGVALFLTALAIGSGQDRDTATLTTTESQLPRLALALSACGLKSHAVAAQALALHPNTLLPAGLEALQPDRAAAILASAAGDAGG